MASGKTAPDPPPLHATRQMLDELDALMERMLALPIDDAEEPAPAPPAPATPPPHSRPLSASLTLLQVPVDEPAPSFNEPEPNSANAGLDQAHAGTNPSHLPTLGTPGTFAAAESAAWPEIPQFASLRLAPSPASEPYSALPELPPAPAIMPEPLSDRVVPPPPVPDLDALFAEVPAPPESLASWFILPVLWGNRVFDQSTMLLGESGHWLRGPAARNTLGTAGLILFGAALLWLARDWLGWTW
jgi:hypothetical protein